VPDYPSSKELNSLGDYIRKKRIDLRLKQKNIEKIIGVDKCTISNWENGKHKPTKKLAEKVIIYIKSGEHLQII